MTNSYRPKHGKSRKKPAALITAHCMMHGYITPRHERGSRYHKSTTTPLLKNLCVLITILTFADVMLFSMHISTMKPYAITHNNQLVCYVDSKEDAEKAIKETAKNLLEDGSGATVISVDSDLEINKAPLSRKSEVSADAAKIISEQAKEEDIQISAKIIKTEQFDEALDPVIEEDSDMLAGQAETVEEGTVSKGEKTYEQYVVNGKIVDEEKISENINEEGTPAVIKKGSRGLPEGEDFKTYEGLPECRSGDDIVATAAAYIGKVPYVWGGKDLETGVDCSGFIIALYRLYGVELGYPLAEEGISVSYDEAEPGDILVFNGHFGLYIGNREMIHASKPGTYVMQSSIGNREIKDIRRIVTNFFQK